MVPAPCDERESHAAEVAARFALLRGLVPDLTYGEWDLLAGFRSVGHARQIGEEGKVPGVPKARRLAAVLVEGDGGDAALAAAWLLCGTGKPPGERRARRSVAAARARVGGRHGAKVRASVTPRKGQRPRSRGLNRSASGRA